MRHAGDRSRTAPGRKQRFIKPNNAGGGLAGSLSCRGRPKTWVGTSDVRPTGNTLRKGRKTGRRGGGPLCPLRWVWIGRELFYGQPKDMDRPTTFSQRHVTFRHPPGNTIRPRHVLQGHSSMDLGMALAEVGLGSSCDVLRSIADGVPIQADGPPSGPGVFGWMSNGADTEVRPPATRVLGPCGGCARWRAHWGFRSRFFLCPLGRGFRMFVQRSGHRGPPPRDPGAGPFRRVFSVASTLGVPIQVFSLPIGAGIVGCLSNGADTEVRPPAILVSGPVVGELFGWISSGGGYRSRPRGGSHFSLSFPERDLHEGNRFTKECEAFVIRPVGCRRGP